MDRRLAAILAADVVGFSALVGRDEEGTVRALKGHLAALEPMIGLNGRLVKSTGDGFLAEFSSVVASVSCAVSMQLQMNQRNAAQPQALQMAFRMGVHTGDVVIDGDDILGDGVNIAARLQTLAAPGGIVVSGRVQDDVADKMDLEFQNLGEQRLKNIYRPVRAFAVVMGDLAPSRRPRRSARASHPSPCWPSTACPPVTSRTISRKGSPRISSRRSPACHGCSSSRATLPSRTWHRRRIRRIGRELGVRYVLEGSVRRADERLRVTGQLIDTETGAHIWAGRFDGETQDVFDLQDRITEAVVAAIAPEIRNAEIERAVLKRPESRDAYDHFLHALAAATGSHCRGRRGARCRDPVGLGLPDREGDAGLAEDAGLAPASGPIPSARRARWRSPRRSWSRPMPTSKRQLTPATSSRSTATISSAASPMWSAPSSSAPTASRPGARAA